MNTLLFPLIFCAAILLGLLGCLWEVRRVRRRARDAAALAAAHAAKDAETIAQLTTQLAETAEGVAQLEVAQALAASERERANRYFSKIQDFQSERDTWQRLYTSQSIGHANAQNLMMGVIGDLAAKLEAKGERVRISPALQQAREEFRETHEEPARKLVAKAEAPATQPLTD